ncbi:MAG: phage holin family protein [Bradymonadaceae bacterium]
MAHRDEVGGERRGLLTALRDLADGLDELVRSQLALLRIEVAREGSIAWEQSAALLLSAITALIGYALLLLGIVVAVGAYAGLTPASVTALALGLFHLVPGLIGAHRQLQGLEHQRERLEKKTALLTGDDSWETQMPPTSPEPADETSSDAEPATEPPNGSES